jgi:hypothetical protein
MDLVIISSAINTCSAPLSYYPIRSVFNKQERYEQTLKTIESLRKIPGKRTYFVECTDIPEYEDSIRTQVDFYKNIYKGNEAVVDGPHKGVGFALSALSAASDDYDNIYMIAGRYYLNDEFNYSLWNNNDTMMWMDSNNGWRLVTFYKINKSEYLQWVGILMSMVRNNEPRAIEQVMMEITDFKRIDKIGVEGYTHGGGFAKF